MTNSTTSNVKTKMHYIWKWIWSAWEISRLTIIALLLSSFIEHIYVFYLYCAFLPLEVLGATKRRWDDAPKGFKTKLGDTYSEWNWWITSWLPARQQFTKMTAWSHGATVYLLFFLADDGRWTIDDFTPIRLIVSVPWLITSIRLSKRLQPHFVKQGTEG